MSGAGTIPVHRSPSQKWACAYYSHPSCTLFGPSRAREGGRTRYKDEDGVCWRNRVSPYDRELAAKLSRIESIEARVARQERRTGIGLLLLSILAAAALVGVGFCLLLL